MLTTTVATLHDNSAHGEDAYLVRALGDHACLDAVIDGVTRRKGGDASRALAAALAAVPLRSVEDIVVALEDVNRHLYQLGGGHFWLSTVATALYLGETLHVVSVGDSPIVLVRSGSCHTFCGGLRGVYVGACKDLPHLYRAQVSLQPGDRILLASDGVTDGVAICDLVQIMRQAASPEGVAAEIRGRLQARRADKGASRLSGGRVRGDDWTAIVRFFGTSDEGYD
jgi:serine/threonine protein phosphatase PrpC